MLRLLLLLLTFIILTSCKTSDERQEDAKESADTVRAHWEEPLDRTRDTAAAVEDIDKKRREQLDALGQ